MNQSGIRPPIVPFFHFSTPQTKNPECEVASGFPALLFPAKFGPLATFFTWLQADRPNHHECRDGNPAHLCGLIQLALGVNRTSGYL
jgi:hypothetical protein